MLDSNPTVILPISAKDETIQFWHDMGYDIVFEIDL
jgi:hypothetical protein